MKFKYLRWIDKNGGILFCSILSLYVTLLRRIGNFKTKHPKETQIRKILVIKFWGFGSIILAAQAFGVLRNAYPRAMICAFTLQRNKQIYEMLGLFDKVFTVDERSLIRALRQLKEHLSSIRKLSFDIALDFEFTSRLSAIITYLTKAKRRIGFKYKGVWRGSGYTDKVEFREDRKLKDSFLGLARQAIGRDNFESSGCPELKTNEEDRKFVDKLLEEEGIYCADSLVGININASEMCLLRRWPREYFRELTDQMIARYNLQFIFIGSRGEHSYVEQLFKESLSTNHKYNFSGKLNLKQLACLLKKMKLFISNDSGPLHLAVHLGIPTVSFFGPETPMIYGPEGETHSVFFRGLSCSPCIRVKNYKHSKCLYNMFCLTEIKPKDVIEAIERKGALRQGIQHLRQPA